MCIHVLALNETKIDRNVPKELSDIQGYPQFRLNRTCSRGGVLVYIRDSIKAKHRDDVPSDTLELLCIEECPPRSRSYFVIAWYRPPSDSVGSFDKLEKALAYLDRESKELIFLGDTNCDFTKIPGDQLIDNNARHLASVY